MRTGTVGQMQKRAWGFYGYPGSPNLPVGEVRYVVGWHADQMTRLEWDVLIDGSEEWVVTKPDGTTISTTKTKTGPDGKQVKEQDLTGASKELLDWIGWTDSAIRAVDTNLFVAGQGTYIQEADTWRVVSVVEPNRKATIAAADEAVDFSWPHPADPSKPDAPLFSVLELLEQLEWLDRQAQTQSRQRSLINGVLATADGLEGPDGKSFFDLFNDVISARMSDPDDLSPIHLSGPADGAVNLIKDGINWIMPPFGYDAVIDRRAQAAINRLAYGLPVPPEILLGMQAQSRATAFQVEENAYRAHIEPPAWMVAQVPEDALTRLLDDRTVEVRPNPSQMLARKQSVEDVKWANAEGLATDDYTREVLGIPDDGAPVSDAAVDPAVKAALDMAVAAPSLAQAPGLPDLVNQIRSIMDGTDYVPATGPDAPIATDPANDAADEPVTAANRQDDLSTLLADIDATLSSELAGVTVMATDRARTKLGAAARTVETVRNNPEYKPLSNPELAVTLGLEGLSNAGVKVLEVAAEPIDVAAKWWTKRIGEVWSQMSVLVPSWSGQGAWVEESVDKLDVALGEHIIDTLSLPDAGPLEAGKIREVVDAAAGGS